ncbi:hypothetical protein [Microvirga sesbaniae]|uniref:hypothetical protein n=1 Tax=Microvirga sesbaniae TaxID=681392 RepID=UPI0021C7C5D1|nr:hypothetical protein [Microvirga sp. HBU67692]
MRASRSSTVGPSDDAGGGILEDGPAGLGEGQGVEFQELRIVVEHLLEMRHEPALVDGVAGEAAADMVVNPAEGHPLQGQEEASLRLVIPGAAGIAGEELENRRVGKLRRALQTAVLRVDQPGEP